MDVEDVKGARGGRFNEERDDTMTFLPYRHLMCDERWHEALVGNLMIASRTVIDIGGSVARHLQTVSMNCCIGWTV